MTYERLITTRDGTGQQTVRAPRVTDIIGYSLRSAFDGSNAVTDDMARALRKLDAVPYHLN